MLHREDPEGLIVIAQPAHAWVSGQLARAWGNERLGGVEPREEICLGAEQHDVGWTEWERAPMLNPRTGRPYSFTELPRRIHMDIWSGASQLVLPQGRYPALLVSLHRTGLYARYDGSGDSPEEVRAVHRFLAQEQAFQKDLLTGLQRDPSYAPHATADAIARNRRLVSTWDWMSLLLCWGLPEPRSIPDVPAADGSVRLELTPIEGDPTEVVMDPWPFQREMVTLVWEGRWLPETFEDEGTMRSRLSGAPWVTIKTRLHAKGMVAETPRDGAE